MESLDLLNLRADECSFLETALTDVRRYAGETIAPADESSGQSAVLVFPPLNARKRFLIHTLIQHFFSELNTISVGSSHGRRTVVYRSSLKPMFCGTELNESNEINNESDKIGHRAYRTPNERKAQEKLFHSLMPKKNVDKNSRPSQRKLLKRPDIPIYVPKARRGSVNNTVPNVSNSTNCSDVTLPSRPDNNSEVQGVSDNLLSSKEPKSSLLTPKLKTYCTSFELTSFDSIQCVDLSNEMTFNDTYNQIETLDITNQISELSSSDFYNIDNLNCSLNSHNTNEITEDKNSSLLNVLKPNIVKTTTINYENDSTTFKCSSESLNRVENSTTVNLPDCQTYHDNEIVDLDLQELEGTKEPADSKVLDSIDETAEKCIQIAVEIKPEVNSENKVVNSDDVSEKHLTTEFEACCPNYCLDDSFASEPSADQEETNSHDTSKVLTIQQNVETVNKSLIIVEDNQKNDVKNSKKKKKKKVLDVDECCWEDLYDKEDDYIHPLLMKEIVSTMGKVQVKCAKEDYRNHQTVEERSGDGECVIEVYGFSSDLKTVDLMNQFAEFRRTHFEIIWVDDTHALAVFESPNLADRALNTPLALVKTRPLKNAIKESKLKAETVAPLPVTRPKTCSLMARRLVSSALGLKMKVSPDLINAERTLLANAKEKKVRDAQQKHSIWNDI